MGFKGYMVRPYYTPHWGSLCGCRGHTLSGSLFWLSLHAPAHSRNVLLNVCVCVCVCVCTCKSNAEVPVRKPVSLSKHYVFACLGWFSGASAQSCSQWMHHPHLYRPLFVTLLSNLITIMYIRALFCCCWLLQGVIIRLVKYATMAGTAVWEAAGFCLGGMGMGGWQLTDNTEMGTFF